MFLTQIEIITSNRSAYWKECKKTSSRMLPSDINYDISTGSISRFNSSANSSSTIPTHKRDIRNRQREKRAKRSLRLGRIKSGAMVQREGIRELLRDAKTTQRQSSLSALSPSTSHARILFQIA